MLSASLYICLFLSLLQRLKWCKFRLPLTKVVHVLSDCSDTIAPIVTPSPLTLCRHPHVCCSHCSPLPSRLLRSHRRPNRLRLSHVAVVLTPVAFTSSLLSLRRYPRVFFAVLVVVVTLTSIAVALKSIAVAFTSMVVTLTSIVATLTCIVATLTYIAVTLTCIAVTLTCIVITLTCIVVTLACIVVTLMCIVTTLTCIVALEFVVVVTLMSIVVIVLTPSPLSSSSWSSLLRPLLSCSHTLAALEFVVVVTLMSIVVVVLTPSPFSSLSWSSLLCPSLSCSHLRRSRVRRGRHFHVHRRRRAHTLAILEFVVVVTSASIAVMLTSSPLSHSSWSSLPCPSSSPSCRPPAPLSSHRLCRSQVFVALVSSSPSLSCLHRPRVFVTSPSLSHPHPSFSRLSFKPALALCRKCQQSPSFSLHRQHFVLPPSLTLIPSPLHRPFIVSICFWRHEQRLPSSSLPHPRSTPSTHSHIYFLLTSHSALARRFISTCSTLLHLDMLVISLSSCTRATPTTMLLPQLCQIERSHRRHQHRTDQHRHQCHMCHCTGQNCHRRRMGNETLSIFTAHDDGLQHSATMPLLSSPPLSVMMPHGTHSATILSLVTARDDAPQLSSHHPCHLHRL